MRSQGTGPPVALSSSVSEQLAAALRYLSEQASSPLERTVFLNAYELCRGVCDQAMEKPKTGSVPAAPTLANSLQGDSLSALQYLEAEAKRHNLQVMECVLMSTISQWMIAKDIEMLRKARLRDDKQSKSHH